MRTSDEGPKLRPLTAEQKAEILRDVTREVVEEARARHRTWPKLTREQAPHLYPPIEDEATDAG